jgi:hypothetical protein
MNWLRVHIALRSLMCIRNESGGRQLSPANGREVKADGKIASGFPCHIARDLCASSRRVIFQAAIRHQAGGAMAKNHIEKCKQSITRQKTSCPAKSIGKGPPCSQNASELPLVRNASQSGSPIDGLLQTLCKVAFSQGKGHSVAVVSGYSNWRTAVILAIEAVIKPWFGSVHFLRTRLYEIHFSVARASTMGST